MTSRTHDNFRHNFWTWVDPPPVWTMFKKTSLFPRDGFPKRVTSTLTWVRYARSLLVEIKTGASPILWLLNNFSLPWPGGIIDLLFIDLFIIYSLALEQLFSTWWQLRRWRCTPPILTTRLLYSQLNNTIQWVKQEKSGNNITVTISEWGSESPLHGSVLHSSLSSRCGQGAPPFPSLERSSEIFTKSSNL